MQRNALNERPGQNVTPLVLDRREAAEALRISLRKFDYLLKRGEITPVRIDGCVRIAWSELERFVQAKQTA